ncbi:MAG: hypothetical protein GF350_06365 [Chitinivibrionales bacterium]|nr:hypothetical protein [Chitinivibrionales bacterium]
MKIQLLKLAQAAVAGGIVPGILVIAVLQASFSGQRPTGDILEQGVEMADLTFDRAGTADVPAGNQYGRHRGHSGIERMTMRTAQQCRSKWARFSSGPALIEHAEMVKNERGTGIKKRYIVFCFIN